MNKNLFIVFLPVLLFSQKIKIKKDALWLGNQQIGIIQKIKVKKDTILDIFYQVSDPYNTPRLKFRQERIESALFPEDKYFSYFTFEEIIQNKKGSIENSKFYLSKKQIAQFLIENNFLNEDGYFENNIQNYLDNHPELPKKIKLSILREQQLLKYIHFKVDRETTDPIFVFFKKTLADDGLIAKGRVTKSLYSIYQGIKDPYSNDFLSKTFIGYALAEELVGNKIGWSVNPPSNYRPHPKSNYNLIIFNTKDVPLASYCFLTYKHYNPFKEFGITESPLSIIESIEEKIKYIANDLIQRQML